MGWYDGMTAGIHHRVLKSTEKHKLSAEAFRPASVSSRRGKTYRLSPLV